MKLLFLAFLVIALRGQANGLALNFNPDLEDCIEEPAGDICRGGLFYVYWNPEDPDFGSGEG